VLLEWGPAGLSDVGHDMAGHEGSGRCQMSTVCPLSGI
jgi:hypothetical protein